MTRTTRRRWYRERVTETTANLVQRREILAGYLMVLNDLPRLVSTCESVSGDVDELRMALADAFGLTPLVAETVARLQVSQFTPGRRQAINEELAELNERIIEARQSE